MCTRQTYVFAFTDIHGYTRVCTGAKHTRVLTRRPVQGLLWPRCHRASRVPTRHLFPPLSRGTQQLPRRVAVRTEFTQFERLDLVRLEGACFGGSRSWRCFVVGISVVVRCVLCVVVQTRWHTAGVDAPACRSLCFAVARVTHAEPLAGLPKHEGQQLKDSVPPAKCAPPRTWTGDRSVKPFCGQTGGCHGSM